MHSEPCSNASQFGVQSCTEVLTDPESVNEGTLFGALSEPFEILRVEKNLPESDA